MNPNTHESRSSESIQHLLENVEKGSMFWEELAILDFTEEVLRRLGELDLTKSQLAERLNVDPAYVSKLIGGSNNFTVRTMVKISRALEAELRFHLQPKYTQAVWIDYGIQTAPVEMRGCIFSASQHWQLSNFKIVAQLANSQTATIQSPLTSHAARTTAA
jgi:transcriptional regulator with XRE-family HTH domain